VQSRLRVDSRTRIRSPVDVSIRIPMSDLAGTTANTSKACFREGGAGILARRVTSPRGILSRRTGDSRVSRCDAETVGKPSTIDLSVATLSVSGSQAWSESAYRRPL